MIVELPLPVDKSPGQPVSNVDDFVPEEGLDASFLEDSAKDTKTAKQEENADSDR